MPVSRGDLEFVAGDDPAWTVLIQYTDGSAADLTGWGSKAQIRRCASDPEVAVEISTSIELPDHVVMTIPHSITETLCGRYEWDLQLVSPEGMITTVLRGAVPVTAEVTREAA